MTLMLGIDTATTGCSVALMDGATCLAENQSRMPRGQSEALAPMIEDAMKSAGISFDRLDGIAVTRGPGAFTGLRIGLAAARAMALSIAKPCIGITTFDSLSAQARQRENIETGTALLVAIESKRVEIFVSMYGFDGALLIEPSALRPEAIEKMPEGITSVIIVGDASQKVESALIGRVDVRRIEDIEVPDAKVVANFGLNLLGTPELATPTPFYLRPPDASIPKQK